MLVNEGAGVALAKDLDEPNQGLDGLALTKVKAQRPVEAGNFVLVVEPVAEETERHVRGTRIALVTPAVHCLP